MKIKKWIREGDFSEGDQLPSEKKLARKFDVVRSTVRKALEELEKDGLIKKVHGKGSFVRSEFGNAAFILSRSFTEMAQELGFKAHSKVLNVEVSDAQEPITENYDFSSNEKVITIERVRMADELPIAVENARIKYNCCAGLEDEDLSESSIYQLLAEKYHQPLIELEQFLRAVEASTEQADYLGVSEGSPLLSVVTEGYTEEGLIEVTKSYFDTNVFPWKIVNKS
ncbi:GntR family transcriptional regulator [Candidatus Bipolaricaulota bacterium]|nr:GntR family transcriptional regulator [Candidatus Bipolaricaulota bacterium]